MCVKKTDRQIAKLFPVDSPPAVLNEVKKILRRISSGFNTVAIEDEDEIGLLTGNVRGKIVYNAGVGYYNSNEIVWLLTTTA